MSEADVLEVLARELGRWLVAVTVGGTVALGALLAVAFLGCVAWMLKEEVGEDRHPR